MFGFRRTGCSPSVGLPVRLRSESSPEEWLRLFRTIDRLVKLQLVVCPDSEFHHRESFVDGDYQALRRLYELLSNGVTFKDASFIEQAQLLQAWRRWRENVEEVPAVVDIECGDVVSRSRKLHGWQEVISISVNLADAFADADRYRRVRSDVETALADIFERWQGESLSFAERQREEVQGYGDMLLRSYAEYAKHFALMSRGLAPFELERTMPGGAARTAWILLEELRRDEVPSDEAMAALRRFLSSQAAADLPFVKIRTMLWATLAREAQSGRKRPPRGSFANDVSVVSLVLPYCDAVLVDNEMAHLLAQEPLRTGVKKWGRVFSPRKLRHFIEYLSDIETQSPKAHLELVREVYGDTAGTPYESLFGLS